MSAQVKIGIVFGLLALGGMALLLLTDAGNLFTYSTKVTDVVGKKDELAGRALRVEGKLTPGSIEFREDPCAWHFKIQEKGTVLPVSFNECVVPDTFRDGFDLTVVVEGQVTTAGVFEASKIIPRCPSKYEMDERKKNGEAMPHGMPVES